ncbi:MAG: CBS domain-containing protein [Candidatus Thermoplasmatota archaeon]|jgi:CBS domain-containing protein
MRVKEIMNEPAVTVEEKTRLDTVARAMLEWNINCVLVVDADFAAVGILTDRDFTAQEPTNPFVKHRAAKLFGGSVRERGLQTLYGEARSMTAGRVMRPIRASLHEEDAVERATDLMVRHGVNHLPVLRNGRAIGTVSRHDLLRMIVGPGDGLVLPESQRIDSSNTRSARRPRSSDGRFSRRTHHA